MVDRLIDYIIAHRHTGNVILGVWAAVVVLGVVVWGCFQPEVDPFRWMFGL